MFTSTGTKFEIKMLSLSKEKDVNSLECYIVLYEDLLVYRAEYTAKVPKDDDDLLGAWDEKYNNFEITVKRSAFVAVDKRWNDKNSHWHVELEAVGYSYTITLFFEEEDENCDKIFKALKEFVHGRDF